MSRCVIISAAQISNYKKLKGELRQDDFLIFCDGGLKHQKKLGVKPSLIVGDFDSIKEPPEKVHATIETIVLPREKDDTDTFYAIKEGLKRGYTDFLLLGVIGGRFDHSLCNVSALIYLYNRGAKATLIDDFSAMRIAAGGETLTVKDCRYFSLMNIAGDAEGVTISGAKYCLENASVKAEFALGVSNENLPDCNAKVTVNKGLLLLVEVE